MSTESYDWEDVRAELYAGDEAALAQERARTEAWVHAFNLAEESPRPGLTQRDVAGPRRTSRVRRQA